MISEGQTANLVRAQAQPKKGETAQAQPKRGDDGILTIMHQVLGQLTKSLANTNLQETQKKLNNLRHVLTSRRDNKYSHKMF